MNYHNTNLINPKVNSVQFIVDGKLNGIIGLNKSSIVGGEGIIVSCESDSSGNISIIIEDSDSSESGE